MPGSTSCGTPAPTTTRGCTGCGGSGPSTPSHPYAAQWWPIGQGIGYGASFANQAADLLEGWPDAPWTPGFRVGAAVQAVCDAMEISAASWRWVKISEVTNTAQPWEGDVWPGG